ncbi:MAG TPA: DsbA family protein [Rhizomicrobium sp.]|jgi:protein-disulfide isomerase
MTKSSFLVAGAGAVGGAVLAVGTILALAATTGLPGTEAQVRNYLLGHPQILADMSNRLQEQQAASDDTARQLAVHRLGPKPFFDSRFAFLMGPANAKTTFVEFFDYNCPYCRASLPSVRKFIADHQKTARFAFIEFPIKGAASTVASRAAIAARKQPDKYLAFHFLLMGEEDLVDENTIYADARKAGIDVGKLKADMRNPSVDSAIADAHSLAAASKIDGTPAFIINGNVREGAVDDATVRRMLKAS